MEGASPFMASRLPRASMGQLVFLTPPKSSRPTQLLSRQQNAPITPLAATLMNLPASVENKRLTVELSPLAATLTKTRGWGPPALRRFDVQPSVLLLLTSPFFSCTYKLPISQALCFDIHASDGGVGVGRPHS